MIQEFESQKGAEEEMLNVVEFGRTVIALISTSKVCKFWYHKDKCNKGDNCNYPHDVDLRNEGKEGKGKGGKGGQRQTQRKIQRQVGKRQRKEWQRKR